MFVINNKRIILNVEHVYFANDVISTKIKCLRFYHNINENELNNYMVKKQIYIRKQYSCYSDISLDSEIIFNGFSKTYKNEIRREMNNKKICFYRKIETDEEKDIFELFKNTYNQMFKNKKMNLVFNEKLLKNLSSQGKLLYSVSYIEGQPYIFHAYIIDGDKAELVYSTSALYVSHDLKNVIGRNNKLLHWEDILYLKKSGVNYLDWGGISDPNNLSGISKFKLAFGSQIFTEYHVLMPGSLLGKIVVAYFNWRYKK